eukprot:GDKJ01013137.1.p1 GENE.GDKJ01013137.1~~GDKJ01013137.1.p1  ORF type:complete len:674 (-),score=193.08 GDKJ01013137.1:76-2043(-)
MNISASSDKFSGLNSFVSAPHGASNPHGASLEENLKTILLALPYSLHGTLFTLLTQVSAKCVEATDSNTATLSTKGISNENMSISSPFDLSRIGINPHFLKNLHLGGGNQEDAFFRPLNHRPPPPPPPPPRNSSRNIQNVQQISSQKFPSSQETNPDKNMSQTTTSGIEQDVFVSPPPSHPHVMFLLNLIQSAPHNPVALSFLQCLLASQPPHIPPPSLPPLSPSSTFPSSPFSASSPGFHPLHFAFLKQLSSSSFPPPSPHLPFPPPSPSPSVTSPFFPLTSLGSTTTLPQVSQPQQSSTTSTASPTLFFPPALTANGPHSPPTNVNGHQSPLQVLFSFNNTSSLPPPPPPPPRNQVRNQIPSSNNSSNCNIQEQEHFDSNNNKNKSSSSNNNNNNNAPLPSRNTSSSHSLNSINQSSSTAPPNSASNGVQNGVIASSSSHPLSAQWLKRHETFTDSMKNRLEILKTIRNAIQTEDVMSAILKLDAFVANKSNDQNENYMSVVSEFAKCAADRKSLINLEGFSRLLPSLVLLFKSSHAAFQWTATHAINKFVTAFQEVISNTRQAWVSSASHQRNDVEFEARCQRVQRICNDLTEVYRIMMQRAEKNTAKTSLNAKNLKELLERLLETSDMIGQPYMIPPHLQGCKPAVVPPAE